MSTLSDILSADPETRPTPGGHVLTWPGQLTVVVLDSGEVGQFDRAGDWSRREIEASLADRFGEPILSR